MAVQKRRIRECRQAGNTFGSQWGIFPEDFQTEVGTSTGFTLLWFGVEMGEGVVEEVMPSAVTNKMWKKLYTLRTSIATVYYSPLILYVNTSYLSKMYVFIFFNLNL